MATASLKGTEFTAERENIKILPTATTTVVSAPNLSEAELARIRSIQAEYQHRITIPRRPKWDENTTAEELENLEIENFLQWRRNLAEMEANEHLALTPFERNLDVWRQLWRVLERSDVVAQIVDARNPLLFRSESLEKYVKEIDENKKNILIISKADLLSPEQRKIWVEYLEPRGIQGVFWTTKIPEEKIEKIEEENEENSEEENEKKITEDEEENDEESSDEEEDEEDEEEEDIADKVEENDSIAEEAEKHPWDILR